MTNKQSNASFPGQKTGSIRVLIKQQNEQQIDTVQLRFNLFEDELEPSNE